MIRTTVHNKRQREVPPAPLLLNIQSQYGTEESGHNLGSNKVSAVTIEIRVSTMETSMKNKGMYLQGIEGILKQLVGSGMASTPSPPPHKTTMEIGRAS